MMCLQHGAATCWVAPEAAVALVTPANAVRAMTTVTTSFFMRETFPRVYRTIRYTWNGPYPVSRAQ